MNPKWTALAGAFIAAIALVVVAAVGADGTRGSDAMNAGPGCTAC